jgi:hypothetical protein
MISVIPNEVNHSEAEVNVVEGSFEATIERSINDVANVLSVAFKRSLDYARDEPEYS